jgi:hypothetical protein
MGIGAGVGGVSFEVPRVFDWSISCRISFKSKSYSFNSKSLIG